VTNGAVALDVAADASADVALRLPGVVARRAGAIGPLRLGGVEAAALREIGEWAGHGDAQTLVAGQAKRLVAMAARALLLIFAGRHRVHAEPVVGMDAPRPDSPIMTIGARFLRVAIGAKARVVSGYGLVPFDPIRTMARVVQPARRRERTRGKADLDQAARISQVTGATLRASATGSRRGRLVTIEASAHPR